MTEWTTRALESACADINRSLEILTRNVDTSVMSVEVAASHFAMQHKRSTLMRKVGIVETVDRRGGPYFTSSGRKAVNPSVYRIHRLNITPDELQQLLQRND